MSEAIPTFHGERPPELAYAVLHRDDDDEPIEALRAAFLAGVEHARRQES